MSSIKTTKVLIVLFVLCLVFFVVALVLTFLVFPKFDKEKITEEYDMRLEDGTIQFEEFLKPRFDYFKIYLFNIINDLDVMSHGARPIVEEVGPFVYRKYHQNTIITPPFDNDTITYIESKYYIFDKEASSPLDEDVFVTVPNILLQTLLEAAETDKTASTANDCSHTIFSGKNSSLIKTTVQELIFEGFNFCLGSSQTTSCPSIIINYFCSFLPKSKNLEVLDDGSKTFSYFRYLQNEEPQKYTINQGTPELADLGKVAQWNEQNYTNFWKDYTECGKIQGTYSSNFPPRITKENTFSIFSSEICRNLKFSYSTLTSYENLNGYIFAADAASFNSTEEPPEEDCFCSEEIGEKCYLDGVMNLQPCTGLPFLVSFPHFLHAADEYNISGLNPSEDQHNSYLILEPETGTLMKSIQRYQLNYYTRPIPDASLFGSFFEGVVPLLWVENEFTQSSNYLKLIKNKYFEDETDDNFFDVLGWSLIGVSAALVFIVFGILVYRIYFRLN